MVTRKSLVQFLSLLVAISLCYYCVIWSTVNSSSRETDLKPFHDCLSIVFAETDGSTIDLVGGIGHWYHVTQALLPYVETSGRIINRLLEKRQSVNTTSSLISIDGTRKALPRICMIFQESHTIEKANPTALFLIGSLLTGGLADEIVFGYVKNSNEGLLTLVRNQTMVESFVPIVSIRNNYERKKDSLEFFRFPYYTSFEKVKIHRILSISWDHTSQFANDVVIATNIDEIRIAASLMCRVERLKTDVFDKYWTRRRYSINNSVLHESFLAYNRPLKLFRNSLFKRSLKERNPYLQPLLPQNMKNMHENFSNRSVLYEYSSILPVNYPASEQSNIYNVTDVINVLLYQRDSTRYFTNLERIKHRFLHHSNIKVTNLLAVCFVRGWLSLRN